MCMTTSRSIKHGLGRHRCMAHWETVSGTSGPLLTPVGQINERGAQIHTELQVPAENFPASCGWASPSLQTSVVLQVCILYIALINNIHLLIFHLYENYAYISEYEVSWPLWVIAVCNKSMYKVSKYVIYFWNILSVAKLILPDVL